MGFEPKEGGQFKSLSELEFFSELDVTSTFKFSLAE